MRQAILFGFVVVLGFLNYCESYEQTNPQPSDLILRRFARSFHPETNLGNGPKALVLHRSRRDLFSDIYDLVSGVVSGVTDTASTVVSGVADTVGTVVSGAVNTTTDIVTGVVNATTDVVTGVANATGTVVSGTTDLISNVVSGVTDAVSGAVDAVVSTVTDVVSGVVDGVAEVATAVTDAVTGVVTAVTGVVSGILSAITDILNLSQLIQAILSFLNSLGFVLLIVEIVYNAFYGLGSLFSGNLIGVFVYAANIAAGILTYSS